MIDHHTDWSDYTYYLHEFLTARIKLVKKNDPYSHFETLDPEMVRRECEAIAWDIMSRLRSEVGWRQINSRTTIRPTVSSTTRFEIVTGYMQESEHKSWVDLPGKKARLWRILGEISGKTDLKQRGMQYICTNAPLIQPIIANIEPTPVQYSISGAFLGPYRVLDGNYFYHQLKDQIIVKEEWIEQGTGYGEVLEECKRRRANTPVEQHIPDSYIGLY